MNALQKSMNIALVVNVRIYGKHYSYQVADISGNVKESKPINGDNWENGVNEYVRYRVPAFQGMSENDSFQRFAERNGLHILVVKNKVKSSAGLKWE